MAIYFDCFSDFMTLSTNERHYFILVGVLDEASLDPYNFSPTKNETDVNYLMKIYKSTQDVFRRQDEQGKEIRDYKQKIHVMTKQLETLQRKTDLEKTLEKVSWYALRFSALFISKTW